MYHADLQRGFSATAELLVTCVYSVETLVVHTGNVLEVNNTSLMTTSCCGNVTYDMRTHRCCDNKYVIPMTSLFNDVQCCAGARQGAAPR